MQRVDLTLVELVESSDRKEDIEALDEALVAFESLASGKAELVKSRTVRVSTKWRQLRRWGFRAARC